jgi:hypothetical protein
MRIVDRLPATLIGTLVVGACMIAGGSLGRAAEAARPELPQKKPDAAGGDADAAAKLDLAAMQGTWTYEYTNKAGAVFRVEKAVVDDRDTVSHFDQQGNLIHAHASEFELKREGPLRLFVILDTVVTAGPDTGKKRPGPRAFCYRIEGDKMMEVWGLLETDRGPPRVIVWDRAKK